MARRLPTYAPAVTEPEPQSRVRPPVDAPRPATASCRCCSWRSSCMVLFPFSENFRLGALIVYPASADAPRDLAPPLAGAPAG